MRLRTLLGLICVVGAAALALNLVNIGYFLDGLPIPVPFKTAGWVIAGLLVVGLVFLGASGKDGRK